MLGWQATIHSERLAQIMVDADIEALAHAGRPWIDQAVVSDWPRLP